MHAAQLHVAGGDNGKEKATCWPQGSLGLFDLQVNAPFPLFRKVGLHGEALTVAQ